MKIKKIEAYEVLDSRGYPTVKVKLETESGTLASASVPSGASTGDHEALELRDGDRKRFQGKGVLKALLNIKEKIAPNVTGKELASQGEVDRIMIELDATPGKSNLGANAILGVSMATARAFAFEKNVPLYEYILEISKSAGATEGKNKNLPDLMCNVINGGAHADSGLNIQEYMLVTKGTNSRAEKIRALAEIYHALKEELKEAGQIVSVGDEGGFAPKLKNNEEPLKYLISAVEKAGYKPGEEIDLALDVAASELYDKETKKYIFGLEKKEFDFKELTAYYKDLTDKYPLVLIEDGMAQDDVSGFQELNRVLGDRVFVMGDDFTVTNKGRLEEAVKNKALNSVLIKLNQIGTVTEAIKCVLFGQENKIKISVSHRSGETCDDFLVDFAVGVGADWIKAGAVTRGERVAKYNRLMEIERRVARST